MKINADRTLTIVCLVMLVLPNVSLAFYLLFVFPLGFLLDLAGLGTDWVVVSVNVVGGGAGLAGGIWVCMLAWPKPKPDREAARRQSNNTLDINSEGIAAKH